MSRNDQLQLGRLLAAIVGHCRICGCESDSCRLETSDLCNWANDEHTLCSAPRCLIAADRQRKDAKRAEECKAERERREADIPAWMRRRKEETERFQRSKKAKAKKVKGRAA